MLRGERLEGWPMQFLLQIDLAELSGTTADGRLAAAGLLGLFYGPGAKCDCVEVIYSPPGGHLYRPPVPDPYQWNPEVFGENTLRADVTYPLVLADTLRYPDFVKGIPDDYVMGQGSVLSLADTLALNRIEDNALPPLRKGYMCSRIEPELFMAHHGYRPTDRDDQPGVGDIELFELYDNEEVGWWFAGEPIQLITDAATARRGVFDLIDT